MARPRLLRLAMILSGGDCEASEDLVQECALKAFRKFDSYIDLQPFEPWVCRILVRVYLDMDDEEKPVSLEELVEQGVDIEDPSAPSEECFAVMDVVRDLRPAHEATIHEVVEGGDLSSSRNRMRRKRAVTELGKRLG